MSLSLLGGDRRLCSDHWKARFRNFAREREMKRLRGRGENWYKGVDASRTALGAVCRGCGVDGSNEI